MLLGLIDLLGGNDVKYFFFKGPIKAALKNRVYRHTDSYVFRIREGFYNPYRRNGD